MENTALGKSQVPSSDFADSPICAAPQRRSEGSHGNLDKGAIGTGVASSRMDLPTPSTEVAASVLRSKKSFNSNCRSMWLSKL